MEDDTWRAEIAGLGQVPHPPARSRLTQVVGEDSRPITSMTSARVLATFGPSAARLTGRPLRWEPHKPGDADAALSTGSCGSSPTASDGDKRSTRQGMQPPAKHTTLERP